MLQYPDDRVPDRLGLDRVDLFPQDVPLLMVRLVRVGIDPGVPEPPLAPAGPPALARLPVLGLPHPGALDRAFPPGPQRLHPAVVRAFGRGQVQVPAGIRAQPHAVPHAGLLKGVPVGQVAGQPVDVADDDHVDLARLDRRDQPAESIAGDFLKRRVPVILEGSHHGPAAPPGVIGTPVKLGRHRLRRVVGLAQTAVHARPELGFRPVCPYVVHESSMTQNHSERMRRLVAADLLPERAGQPVKAWVHISLADLMVLDGSSALQEEWTARVRAQWAAHRAAASVSGSDGGAWLDGDAAAAMACDAAMTPIVTGEVNPAALEDLVRLCAELDRLRHHPRNGGSGSAGQIDAGGTDDTDAGRPGTDGDGAQGAPGPDTARAWEALEQAIIGKAVGLVSGPGGLASFLRRRQLGARLGGPSLPLDVGVSRDIPAAIRHAIILRDQHCRWTGGCDQPASACEVHHLTHKADGGKTSVKDCALFCWYHHHVVIHQMGWTVELNPDGTTTAWNPDKTKVLHSHSPPANTG